jgi:hypothetical protein
MTQVARPGEAMTTLTAVAPADLYEVVDGQKVEKTPLGAYETLLGSRLNTRLDSFASAHDCGRAVSKMLFHFGPSLPQRRPDVA